MRRHAKALLLTVAVFSFFGCTAGQAAAGYSAPTSFSGLGNEPGQFEGPGRAAVEQSTGNLFVVDSGGDRVQVFAPNGAAADYLTSFGQADLSEPWGVAVAEEGGTTYVYVADVGNDRIVKFESDGAEPPAFTVATSFAAPGATALAVDPTSGDVLAADATDKVIERFEADGTFLSSFDGSNGGAAFDGPVDVAVNSGGDVYVIDANDPKFGEGESAGTSRALRYSGAGEFGAELMPVGPSQRPATVAVDPVTDHVLVSGTQDSFFNFGPGGQRPTLHLFDAANAPLPITDLDASAASSWVTGLAIAADGRHYVALDYGHFFGSQFGQPQIQAFALVPDTVTSAPTNVDSSGTARLRGTVNPLNHELADCHFAYGIAALDQTAPCAETPAEIGTGGSPVPVHVDLTNLPAGAYRYRLVASGANGIPAEGETVSFPITGAEALAVGPDASSARLRGKVIPGGIPTTYRFEYGTSTSYGSVAPAQPLAAGSVPTVVTRFVEGLTPGTTYHFRLAVENVNGIIHSVDRSFTTPAVAPPARVYEMVSPPDKGGVGVLDVGGQWAWVSPDGQRVIFQAANSLPGAAASLVRSQYLAVSSPNGWSTRSLDIPQLNSGAGFLRITSVEATSRDLSHSVVNSRRALTPGAIEGGYNTYLQDMDSGALQLIFASSSVSYFYIWSPTGQTAGSKDFSHIVFVSTDALTSDAPDNGLPKLYEFTEGKLSYVNQYPDGTAIEEPITWAAQEHPSRGMSEDGSRSFFTVGVGGNGEEGRIGLYMREKGKTVAISASQRSGEEGQVKWATFLDASADGSIVYFRSRGVLTDESNPGDGGPPPESIYRYDVETEQLTDLLSTDPATDPAGAGVTDATSATTTSDGRLLYFYAGGNLSLWESGQVKVISPIERVIAQLVTSPNGRVVAWSGFDQTTGYDNVNPKACPPHSPDDFPGRCKTVFVMDPAVGHVECASCDPTGKIPLGHADLGGSGEGVGLFGLGSVTDDGRVFFNSKDKLSSDDVNGQNDVYEWHRGVQNLISTGRSGAASRLGDATGDGTVYFTTAERLVGIDADDNVDLYLSRIGGDAGSQNPPSPRPPCAGDGCQLAAGTAPAVAGAATRTVVGKNSARPSRKARKCRVGKRAKHGAPASAARRKHAKHRANCGRRTGK